MLVASSWSMTSSLRAGRRDLLLSLPSVRLEEDRPSRSRRCLSRRRLASIIFLSSAVIGCVSRSSTDDSEFRRGRCGGFRCGDSDGPGRRLPVGGFRALSASSCDREGRWLALGSLADGLSSPRRGAGTTCGGRRCGAAGAADSFLSSRVKESYGGQLADAPSGACPTSRREVGRERDSRKFPRPTETSSCRESTCWRARAVE